MGYVEKVNCGVWIYFQSNDYSNVNTQPSHLILMHTHPQFSNSLPNVRLLFALHFTHGTRNPVIPGKNLGIISMSTLRASHSVRVDLV
jgi:hypothetical protein